MPFTLSHTAAVVPLARRLRLPLSALVVGCMSPDFTFFLYLNTDDHIGHTFRGVWVFCLPVSLAVLWLWHRVVKRPAVALLPPAVQQRVAPVARLPFRFDSPARLLRISAAVVLGVLTHMVWDAFTHGNETGWGVELLPALRTPVPFPVLGHVPAFSMLQHLSSLSGLMLVGWWLLRWFRPAPARGAVLPLRGRLAWWLLTPVVVAAASAAHSWWVNAPLVSYRSVREFIVLTIVGCVTFSFAALLGFALWYSATHRRLNRPVAASRKRKPVSDLV